MPGWEVVSGQGAVMLLQRLFAACAPGLFYGWVVVVLVGFGVSCSGPGHSYFFLSFVDSFMASLGVSRTTVAGLWSSCLLCAAATEPIGGALIDRIGPRKMLIAIALPFSAATAALGLVQTPTQLFATIFVVRSLGPGWLCIGFNKLFNGWWLRRRGRAAAVLGLFGQTSLLCVPATRALIDAVGWRATYFWSAAIILATLCLVLPCVRDRAEQAGLRPDGDAASSNKADGSASPVGQQQGLSFRAACGTVFFPVFCFNYFECAVVWGALNFHIDGVFAESGLSRTDVSWSCKHGSSRCVCFSEAA